MPVRRLRAALAAAVAAPLLVVPLGAQAGSPPLGCPGTAQTGLWQRLPIADFKGVEGVRSRDAVTAYSLDAARPQQLLVTNGTRIQRSPSGGCGWDDVLALGAQPTQRVPLTGTTSTIVATAQLPGSRSLAAVREGTGAASRPHVLSSDSGADGTWSETSAGLPAQGSPRLLEPAGDGRTAYLALSPTTDGGSGGGGLPGLPPVGGGAAGPAGLLYATTDGGRSWQLRTTAGALPSGATGFDALSVDPADPDLVYGLAGDRLVVSRDGGRSITVAEPTGVTAVEAMERGEVAVLLAGGSLLRSTDGARTFDQGHPAPPGATSAAYRAGDGVLVVEADGRLFRVDARGRARPVLLDAGAVATRGSARGDRAANGTFHALAGDLLLRFVDPAPKGVDVRPVVPADQQVPPPPPGRVTPARRAVSLPVGSSREVDFVLDLPRSPTPLDLYIVLDVSQSMSEVIDDIKANLIGVADEVAAQGIDLRVGLGTVAAGPRPGEAPYPDVDPQNPSYRKPDVYKRVRAVGPVGAELRAALSSVGIQKPPTGRSGDGPPEGQLIGLQQSLLGDGVVDERLGGEARQAYVVPPGQDARFRRTGGVRKIVALATDEPFTVPYGTPTKPDGSPDVEGVGAQLRGSGVRVIGLTAKENGESKPDLQRMARLTGTFAPPGGIDCGDEIFLDPGEPLVCDSSRNFSAVIGRVLKALTDRQSVALVPRAETPVLGDVEAAGLRDLDVTVPNSLPFRVRVSCVDVAPGRYTQSLDAVLRGTRVATAAVDVTCTPAAAAAAAVPPRPPAAQTQQEPAAPPAGQPAAQVPAPPAPAPPVVQPQPQPQAQAQTQVQAQVQPLTAAALQQQQELQLALALSADEKPSFGNELAMVDRRSGEELRAVALLATSMAIASAVGLARLRARPRTGVRRSS